LWVRHYYIYSYFGVSIELIRLIACQSWRHDVAH